MASQGFKYPFPVYGTQGGGLAKAVGSDSMVWVEPPKEFPEVGVGDFVPREWGVTPANGLFDPRLLDDLDDIVEDIVDGFCDSRIYDE